MADAPHAHSPPNLDAVIAAAQAGDEGAYARLYAEFAGKIFTLLYRLVARRAQAEDLLQDTFVEVLRSIDSYKGVGSFEGWLRSIAVNKALSQLRSPWHRSVSWLDDSLNLARQLESATPPPEHAFAAQSELERALQQLSPMSRAVVWLYDVEGYTHEEIARAVGRTVSFSKSQLARAHQRLRELLVSEENVSCPPATHSLSTSS